METNYSLLLWENNIQQILHQKRKDGKSCLSHKNIGIPMEVRKGRYNKLYDWEKVYFLKGVKSGKWDIKGNHLKDNNPYKNWKLNKNIVGKKKVKKLYE